VNVSPLQLKDPHFLEKIVDILERTDMNPKDLELEITESALVDDMEHDDQAPGRISHSGVSRFRLTISALGTPTSAN
jgi:EAL domain-containing protein (putative c-di-GMP-specific phosphodiesterase class I)